MAAAALVAAATVVTVGCNTSASPADAEASTAVEVGQLRDLERPVVRHLKLGFIALSTRRQPAAAEELERATEQAGAVLEWLERHEEFAQANEDALGCLEESLPELHEHAEQLIPRLRRGSVPTAGHRELRIHIAEAVNCIQASD